MTGEDLHERGDMTVQIIYRTINVCLLHFLKRRTTKSIDFNSYGGQLYSSFSYGNNFKMADGGGAGVGFDILNNTLPGCV